MTKENLKKHLQLKIEKEEKLLRFYSLYMLNSVKNVENCTNTADAKSQLTLQNSLVKANQKIERLKDILGQINLLNVGVCCNCGKEILVVKKKSHSLCTACATKSTNLEKYE